MKARRIVAAVDFSPVSLLALKAAVALAAESRGRLYVVHVAEPVVVPSPMTGIPPAVARVRRKEEQRLRRLVSPRVRGRGVKVELAILDGSPAEEIGRFAARQKADLIVAGTHGRTGLSRLLLGSTAEALLREAPCRVLVIKETAGAARGSRRRPRKR